MNNYIVSARKYRPSTFRSVVGQRALTTTLKNAIATNKLAHAYLFCGPRGVGKTTCARIFAKTINCLHPTNDGDACNQCESCSAFNEQRSFNIHELDAASNNSVDDIRSLIDQVRIPPQIGKYKVYIIDEVHMLSAAAFNAFLKTLEEPPHHAVFILATTEKHKILPTILSRCQIYDFSRISINDIVEHLQYVASQENVTAETEALNVLAQKADGGMRDALSIFDQVVSFTGGNVTYKAVIDNLNVLDYEYYFKLTDAILSANVVDGMLILNDILSKGFDGHNIITGIASHFRDLLLCKDTRTAELFEVGASTRQKYTEMAQRCSADFLYKAIDVVNQADLNYRASRNKRLLADLTIIKLCQLSSSPQEVGEKKNDIIQPIKASSTSETRKKELSPEVQAPINSQPATIRPIPQISNKPVATTTPPPRSINKLGVSLSAIAEAKEQKEPQENNTEVLNEHFSPLQLINAWRTFAEASDNHLLKNMMIACLPNLVSNHKFEVSANLVQQQRLVEHQHEILSELRKALRNTNLGMSIVLLSEDSDEEKDKKAKFGTNKEKFDLMADQNESLLRLRNEFGLEFD